MCWTCLASKCVPGPSIKLSASELPSQQDILPFEPFTVALNRELLCQCFRMPLHPVPISLCWTGNIFFDYGYFQIFEDTCVSNKPGLIANSSANYVLSSLWTWSIGVGCNHLTVGRFSTGVTKDVYWVCLVPLSFSMYMCPVLVRFRTQFRRSRIYWEWNIFFWTNDSGSSQVLWSRLTCRCGVYENTTWFNCNLSPGLVAVELHV